MRRSTIEQYKRASKINEKTFGVDHTNSAFILANLGATYLLQGKYDEAISLLRQPIILENKSFRVDHIHTADMFYTVGLAYVEQRKYDVVVIHFERALSIKDKAYGPEHIRHNWTARLPVL
jgi:tetratricopeptide (TPR) repeat protein